MALAGIDGKVPGIDGFNSYLFKKYRHIIKDKDFIAIGEFFKSGTLPDDISYTLVTLIPKVAHPSSIKEYMLIA